MFVAHSQSQSTQTAMQNLEDADVVEETSVPGPNEQDQHFKIVDLLTPERTMETEVEMLGFRPGAWSSQS